MRRLLWSAVLVVVLAVPASARAEGGGAALLATPPDQYRQAVVAHDAALAARLRTETALLAAGGAPVTRLARALDATRDQFQPWPTASTVARLAARAQPALGAPLRVPQR